MSYRSAHDVVIVGGGSAGCVLASRLSEDPSRSVLLLEAGSLTPPPAVDDPREWANLWGTEVDWALSTEPQPAGHQRRVRWPRGRVIGGSSSINALVWVRGASHDYDRWAELGATGWAWPDVVQAFCAIESYAGSPSPLRGDSGPLHVENPKATNPLSAAFIEAALDCGYEWTDDLNAAPVPSGVGWNQLTLADGVRQSAFRAFLAPALGRSNLDVVGDALVTRVQTDGDGRALAVEYFHEGAAAIAIVDGELLLSAGATSSPQLLMLSGIGNPDELSRHAIPVAIPSSGVGQNLHDHPGVGLTWRSKRRIPPGQNQHSEVGLFCKSAAEVPHPDLQFGLLHVPFCAEGFIVPENAFSLYPSVLKPKSRGTLRLRSASPTDRPLIDPAYLTRDEDVATFLRAIRLSRELVAAPALRGWAGEEVYPGAAAVEEAALRDYVASAVDTWFHPVGTCRMGSDPDAVVDPELRLAGSRNIRVIDASVFPEIPSGNTNAPTLMLAWRAAEFVDPSLGTASSTYQASEASA